MRRLRKERLAVLLVTVCSYGFAAVSPATESGPRGVVVNTSTNMTYAITSVADTVTAIDGTTGRATAIAVGHGPKAVAMNPVSDRVYVINEHSGTMSVIDGAVNRVIATVDVGPLPSVLALNPVTNK